MYWERYWLHNSATFFTTFYSKVHVCSNFMTCDVFMMLLWMLSFTDRSDMWLPNTGMWTGHLSASPG
jgi:hypothetical protein